MANRALLLATYSTDPPWDHDGRYLRDGLLGANYGVPILWLSLFDTDALVTWPGIDEGFPYTALIQPARQCIDRSRRRVQDWSRRWPQVFGEIHEPWLDYIGAVDDEYLAVWTEEISAMTLREDDTDDAKWATQLRADVSCLDDPESADFRQQLVYIGLESNGRFEPGNFVTLLTAGYTWSRQAPWEGAGHGPYSTWDGIIDLSDPGQDDYEAHRRECRPCAEFPRRSHKDQSV
jgi:hypothetical protein